MDAGRPWHFPRMPRPYSCDGTPLVTILKRSCEHATPLVRMWERLLVSLTGALEPWSLGDLATWHLGVLALPSNQCCGSRPIVRLHILFPYLM